MNIRRRCIGSVTFTLALVAMGASQFAQATPDRLTTTREQAISQLSGAVSGQLSSASRTPELYTTVHSQSSTPLLVDNAASSPLSRAQFFLSVYGGLYGVTDAASELRQTRLSRDGNGNTHVHLDQVYQGLPVFGARVVVHMNDAGIIGTNGVFVDGLQGLSTEAKMPVAALRARGLAAARKLHPDAQLSVESSRLMIYRTGLLKGLAGKNFLAYEVMVKGAAGEGVRERLILNANSGGLLNRINEIHSVLNREIYTPTMDAPPVLTEGSALAPADPEFAGDTMGDPASSRVPPIGVPDLLLPLNNLYIFAGGTYTLYKNLFGRDGYDDGATAPEDQVQRSVYLVNENCPNAYWDGTSTNYCPLFDADDVVSHEWSHAYTEYTHGLVYQYQSGALNEAYSDIFGETYDLVNGIEGPLGVTLTEGTTYDNGGSRWVVGEDLSEVAAGLLLRDMWDPDAFPTPSPGSVITSENYYCGTSDNGGVHTNSGVANHAYAMLVDGKEFNGYTIPKIGLIKAAHIYFQAETHHQTPTTNYAQHADALEQSCQELIGEPLNDVFGNVSGDVITAADCDAVHTATLAVEFRGTDEMSVAEKCDYIPVLQPEDSTPALCPSGESAVAVLNEDWESGMPASWTLGKDVTGDTEAPHFVFETSGDLPSPHTGHAAFALDDTGGTCASGGDYSGSHWMDSPAVTVAEDALFLEFSHFMQAEAGYDGGNLKYSINGADFAVVPDAAFTYNGHSGSFSNAPLLEGVPDPTGLTGNNTNPLASQSAWTGSDQGEATGSWGDTIVDLGALGAVAGDSVVFRWEWGNDGCGGNLGWFVDDVQVYSCAVSDGGTTGGSTTGGSTTGGSTTGGSTTGGSTTGGATTGSNGTGGGSLMGLDLLALLAALGWRRRRMR
ncbi:M4 family metallopeptidase [Solimonas marina]|uniref:M4 family metallopeptidase n=1 Tax=Solimonas marina TaxID=2714601 RepID=A0A970B887_9GAMM|nr:M4 family metallopeptidase [Solimonas marina]NKF24485.1 M4 family metallopeptidase [Solimonas marina]